MTGNAILVVEDQDMVRDLLVAGLKAWNAFDHIYEAKSVEEAFERLNRNPDIIIVLADVALGDRVSFDILRGMKMGVLGSQKIPKCIFLTALQRPSYVEEAKSIDADGFLLKYSSFKELKQAISAVLDGKKYFSSNLVVSSNSQTLLSSREIEILNAIAKGKSNKTIAAEVGLTTGTVKNYIHNIFQKTNATNRVEALVNAQEKGWI